jgi:hypothetical protein
LAKNLAEAVVGKSLVQKLSLAKYTKLLSAFSQEIILV